MPLFNFSGIASGIDTEGIVEATVQVRRQTRVVPKEDKVSELESTNSALEELKSKLLSLRTLSQSFGSLAGGIVSKLASSTDESIATAVASKSATTGSYTITTTQIARNSTSTFASAGRTYTAPSDPINPDINDGALAADRTASVTIGTGGNAETVDIVLTSTSSLDDFVSQYNTSATKSTAALINVGTASAPDYQVLVTSDNQGTEQGSVAFSFGTEITTAGLGAFDDNATSAAQNAEFTMDGVSGTITRQSNTVSDLIGGVSFNLQDIGTTTIQVGVDEAGTQQDVEEYVELFNEIVALINENNLVTRENDDEDEENIFGPLAKTQVDDGVLTAIRSDMSGSSLPNTGSKEFTIFAALGITTDRDGTFKLDTEKLQEAINKEPDSVQDLFTTLGDRLGKTGGTIDNYTRFNGLLDSTVNNNKSQIQRLQDDIENAERFIEKESTRMRMRFARLEGVIGEMQSQQQALTGLLAGLG